MIAVILAAGASKRMRPLTNEKPKCLLDVGGGSLLSRHLDLLEEAGVTETLIVTGFNAEAVIDEVSKKTRKIKIRTIKNERYETTHPIESFLLSESFVAEDFFLLNSDIYFSIEVLNKLLASPGSGIAVDSSSPFVENEMFVEYTADMKVTAVSKHLQKKDGGQAKSVQIAKFISADKDTLFERARELAGGADVFYPTQAYDTLIQGKRFSAVDVAGAFTHELDTVADYEELQKRLGLS